MSETTWTPESRRRANRRLLDNLAALWDEVPDQRLGQLVMNLSREPRGSESGFADTWEWKHGTWLARITEYAAALRTGER